MKKYLFLFRDPFSAFGVVVLFAWFIAAVMPFFIPDLVHIPINLAKRLTEPSALFWLGVDSNGQSIAQLLVAGAHTALLVSVFTVGISLVFGIFFGAFAGYFGGKIDFAISRSIDILLAFPPMILPIAIMAFFGSGLWNVVLALSISGWVVYARLIRGQFLSLKSRDFVVAAQSLGASSGRVMFLHLLPNVFSPLLVQTIFSFSSVILAEAGLSFLGLGVGQNSVSWGAMLSTARDDLTMAPWLTFYPACVIFCVVVALNFVGEALRRQFGQSSKN